MTVNIRTAEQDRDYITRPQKGILESMMQLGYFRYSQSTKWKPALNVYEDEESLGLAKTPPGAGGGAPPPRHRRRPKPPACYAWKSTLGHSSGLLKCPRPPI